MASKKLYRSRNRVLGGVLAGIAVHLDVDVVLVRLIYILLSLFSAGFPGLIVYIILWAVIPDEPNENIPYE
ncbi:PspC domain-containing protein [Maribellus mangrovi]|uniref:PspC domain-containing protein n=1 Tax=Maribellus mangrovi TaxID=3133146 RepID=UPI0030EB14BB